MAGRHHRYVTVLSVRFVEGVVSNRGPVGWGLLLMRTSKSVYEINVVKMILQECDIGASINYISCCFIIQYPRNRKQIQEPQNGGEPPPPVARITIKLDWRILKTSSLWNLQTLNNWWILGRKSRHVHIMEQDILCLFLK